MSFLRDAFASVHSAGFFAQRASSLKPERAVHKACLPLHRQGRCISRIGITLAALAAAAGGACEGPGAVTQTQALQDKIDVLQRRVVAQGEDIRAQAEIIQALRALKGERALDRLVHVASIEIARLSGGYDDDGDGVDDGIKVYLRLHDGEGDAIKATGAVLVRLLDLAKPEGSQSVGRRALNPEQLRPLWYGRFLTYHYTITVPWAEGASPPQHKAITVLVRFTDLLSGRTVETQKVVDVTGLAPATVP